MGKEEVKAWREKSEEENIHFKMTEKQWKEATEGVAREVVVGVLKQKELLREMTQKKKCVDICIERKATHRHKN